MAKARLVKASKANLSETAPDQGQDATSTSNVDNEVISTPAQSNPSILVPNLENITPTNASHLRFMTKVIMQLIVYFLILCDPL